MNFLKNLFKSKKESTREVLERPTIVTYRDLPTAQLNQIMIKIDTSEEKLNKLLFITPERTKELSILITNDLIKKGSTPTGFAESMAYLSTKCRHINELAFVISKYQMTCTIQGLAANGIFLELTGFE